MKSVLNFFRFNWYGIGPCIYLDFTFCFFLIKMQLFIKKEEIDPSCLILDLSDLTNKPRQISPFLLNLNLNPLYSKRGGSTTWAEPFTKKPTSVDFLWNPLYKWKTLSHLTFVLSDTFNQVCLLIILIINGNFFALVKPSYPLKCSVVLSSPEIG